MDFLGPSVLFKEGQKIYRGIHSKIHDRIPAKSTHVVNNGVGKSTLHKEGRDSFPLLKKVKFLVNLFLTNLVRISGFSSLFSAIAVFLALSGKMC